MAPPGERLEALPGVEVVAVSPSVLVVRSTEPLEPRELVELAAALREAWLRTSRTTARPSGFSAATASAPSGAELAAAGEQLRRRRRAEPGAASAKAVRASPRKTTLRRRNEAAKPPARSALRGPRASR